MASRFQNDWQILACLGARRADTITGAVNGTGWGTSQNRKSNDWSNLPLWDAAVDLEPAVSDFLRFVYLDSHYLIDASTASQPLRARICPNKSGGSLINRYSGRFDLTLLYGTDCLAGDVHRELAFCLTSPWDPTKMRSGQRRSVPRLSDLTTGPGAPLDEGYFRALPDHLRSLFVTSQGALRDVPALPDRRIWRDNGVLDVVARLLALHNRVAEHVRSREGRAGVPVQRLVRAVTRQITAQFLRKTVLPQVCDHAVLTQIHASAPVTYPLNLMPGFCVVLAAMMPLVDLPFEVSRAWCGRDVLELAKRLAWIRAATALPQTPRRLLGEPARELLEFEAKKHHGKARLGPVGTWILAEAVTSMSRSALPRRATDPELQEAALFSLWPQHR